MFVWRDAKGARQFTDEAGFIDAHCGRELEAGTRCVLLKDHEGACQRVLVEQFTDG